MDEYYQSIIYQRFNCNGYINTLVTVSVVLHPRDYFIDINQSYHHGIIGSNNSKGERNEILVPPIMRLFTLARVTETRDILAYEVFCQNIHETYQEFLNNSYI